MFIDNEEYEKEEQQAANQARETVEKPKGKEFFAYWKVAGEKLKLKLTTAATMELEKKFRKNLISLIGDEDNIPPLTTMLQVIHAAAEPWQHGIKFKAMPEYFEKYLQEGGTQLNLYVDVYMKVFMVSGFFSSSMVEDMEDSMEQIQTKM